MGVNSSNSYICTTINFRTLFVKHWWLAVAKHSATFIFFRFPLGRDYIVSGKHGLYLRILFMKIEDVDRLIGVPRL
jgi:hypothetical protein